ncbi:MAG: 6-phosphogluconolactonase [Verrucomicrobia bacterium]|nr:6-phosphogluconolactonase [Verrucomicrobiota bacterium]
MIKTFDARRGIALFNSEEEAIVFSVEHWIKLAKKAIDTKGAFFVALSGGSTPKQIFSKFTPDMLDWSRVFLFWSDERNAPPTDKESNYKMALDAGFGKLPIPKEQIFRMHAEDHIEENAKAYEKTISKILQGRPFDLIMLGMGDDGHTASLFPDTEALLIEDRLVVANYVPSKETTRMTFTFPLINKALHTVFYVLGKSKAEAVLEVFSDKRGKYPASHVGTPSHPSLWILDKEASSMLNMCNL